MNIFSLYKIKILLGSPVPFVSPFVPSPSLSQVPPVIYNYHQCGMCVFYITCIFLQRGILLNHILDIFILQLIKIYLLKKFTIWVNHN